VRGENPTQANVNATIDAIVEDTYRNNAATSRWLNFIPLALWQSTARLVLAHESNALHFAVPSGRFTVGRISFAFTTGPRNARVDHRVVHGKEQDMPTYGAPHGYGIGQLDPPGNQDRVWNLVENLREAARRFMIAGGQGARNVLGHEFTTPGAVLSQRSRAVFHRQVVRAYNSGPGSTEFAFVGGDWVISPSIKYEPNIYYPDGVLVRGGLVRAQVTYEDLLADPQQRGRSPANRLPNPPLSHVPFTNAHFPAGL
jgi:hypothetical protein